MSIHTGGALNLRHQTGYTPNQGVIMAGVIFGNHSAVRVPQAEKDRIRKFYRDV